MGIAKFYRSSNFSGDKIIVDLNVTFDDSATYDEIQSFLCKVSKGLKEEIENCIVSIIVTPISADLLDKHKV